MRILLDECLPRKLKKGLAGHSVHTAPEMGWAGKTNGELLKLAAGGFDVFITVDRNLSLQKSIPGTPITIVSLSAKSNRLEDLLLLMPQVLSRLSDAKSRRIVRISA